LNAARADELSAGVDYEYKAVNLLKGEQSDPGRRYHRLLLLLFAPSLSLCTLVPAVWYRSSLGSTLWLAEFIKINPMKFVPALVDGDAVIGDSYAIALASADI
jgi:maleylacetoacetate isomerase